MANSPARSIIDVGSVIADTYTIEALIGRGGMGAVFLASHNRLPGKQVAIKLLHAELVGEEVLVRFRHEAEIATRLGHPNIVTVHDFNVTSDGTPYLVLEYLQGESLGQRLVTGPLPLDQVLSIVRQVGSALAAAHREGIVHRDLKPQNIFLVPTEVDGRMVEIAKVLDFGISKMRGSQTVKTQESMLLGTPQYMAPEQAKGEHASVDARTDIFAFGAIVYEMLCGHPAFSGASIPEVVFKVVYEPPLPLDKEAPTASPNVIAAVNQAMAKPAAARFSTVSEFVEAMTGQPVSVFRMPSVPPADAGSPSAARVRSTGHDAFANTMGSGDHADAMAATSMPPITPRPITAAPVVSMHARTVESQQGVEIPKPQPPKPEAPHRRSPLLVVGVGLGAAIAAVAVMYFVMSSRSGANHEAAADARVAVVDPPHGIDAPHVALAPDAVVAVLDAVVANASPDAALVKPSPDAAIVVVRDPKKPPPRPDAGTTSGTVPGPDAEDPVDPDDKIGVNLRKAQSALNNGNYESAEKLANAVSRSPGTERQLARAYGILGVVHCLHDNEEGAGIDLRNIPMAFRNLRSRILDTCHPRGYLPSITR